MKLVTGATGFVGSRVVMQLRKAGADVAALVRDVAKAREILPIDTEVRIADYDDETALLSALHGATEVLIIPSNGTAAAVTRHTDALLRTAALVGVPRVLLLSIVDVGVASPFYFAPVYQAAEARLRGTFREWTILRCGLYSDFALDHWVLPGTKSGTLLVPGGDARVSFVSRETIASAAVAALSSKALCRETLALTGSTALSFAEVARLASEAYAVQMSYTSCASGDYLSQMQDDVPSPWPEAFSSLFASIRQGRYASVSRDIEHLTGKPPETWAEFLNRRRRDATSAGGVGGPH